VLFLGIDNAGKTTLLGKLKNSALKIHQPTKHPNNEELRLGSMIFNAIDMGGHENARKLWKDYYNEDVDAIVYLVDVSDTNRLGESKGEFRAILKEESLKNVPIAVLGTKIDLKTAISEDKLKDEFGIRNLTTGKEVKEEPPEDIRPLEVFMCSLINDEGFGDAFRWIASNLEKAV